MEFNDDNFMGAIIIGGKKFVPFNHFLFDNLWMVAACEKNSDEVTYVLVRGRNPEDAAMMANLTIQHEIED